MGKFYRVNLLIEAPDEANAQEVAEFLYELEWVGGCRDPDNDPMFDSVRIINGCVTNGRNREPNKSGIDYCE